MATLLDEARRTRRGVGHDRRRHYRPTFIPDRSRDRRVARPCRPSAAHRVRTDVDGVVIPVMIGCPGHPMRLANAHRRNRLRRDRRPWLGTGAQLPDAVVPAGLAIAAANDGRYWPSGPRTAVGERPLSDPAQVALSGEVGSRPAGQVCDRDGRVSAGPFWGGDAWKRRSPLNSIFHRSCHICQPNLVPVA